MKRINIIHFAISAAAVGGLRHEHQTTRRAAAAIAITRRTTEIAQDLHQRYGINKLCVEENRGYMLQFLGDGVCDVELNTPECAHDGHDCDFLNAFFAVYPNCVVSHPNNIGDGYCNMDGRYNSAECGYDFGDCCPSTCQGPCEGPMDCRDPRPDELKGFPAFSGDETAKDNNRDPMPGEYNTNVSWEGFAIDNEAPIHDFSFKETNDRPLDKLATDAHAVDTPVPDDAPAGETGSDVGQPDEEESLASTEEDTPEPDGAGNPKPDDSPLDDPPASDILAPAPAPALRAFTPQGTGSDGAHDAEEDTPALSTAPNKSTSSKLPIENETSSAGSSSKNSLTIIMSVVAAISAGIGFIILAYLAATRKRKITKVREQVDETEEGYFEEGDERMDNFRSQFSGFFSGFASALGMLDKENPLESPEVDSTKGSSAESVNNEEGISNGGTFEVSVPPGKLGIVLYNAPLNGVPIIHLIREKSCIRNQVQIGDELISVDGEDVRDRKAVEVSNLISSMDHKPRRKLIFVRPSAV